MKIVFAMSNLQTSRRKSDEPRSHVRMHFKRYKTDDSENRTPSQDINRVERTIIALAEPNDNGKDVRKTAAVKD